eukprot:gnl/Hemi2/5715_TR1968_c0_g1_i1.p1 gnl/Hemi2/5715_TR1968_c0_g1~~gnl/Hemi2/5715_TR1968_c0_g1_i1.p1  ORF type:complete len:417 (+),score=105.78 gnl/Hemi2/5715_TR1968_c0_g1_i1:80-1330(+)
MSRLNTASALAHNPAVISNPAVNTFIYQLFFHQRFVECSQLIEAVLKRSNGLAEYALYVKALIKRSEGKIEESLQLFHAATMLNPKSVANLKQVARSLYLLGKHSSALEVYDEVQKITGDDWDLLHNKGLCFLYLRKFDESESSFTLALAKQPHDSTYTQLARVYILKNDYKKAIETYKTALQFSPENAEILNNLGILCRRHSEQSQAANYFQSAFGISPSDPKIILASGSMYQVQGDTTKAIGRYRTAARLTPNSAQLWNNIGLCFFTTKQNYIAAVSCLKRALYLDPFEWIISYNLGLVHLYQSQYVTAFHHLRCAINLKPSFAHSYMLLGIVLCRLGDVDNGYRSYQKALSLEKHHLFELNFAISLLNNGQRALAKEHYEGFVELAAQIPASSLESEVVEMRDQLVQHLSREE